MSDKPPESSGQTTLQVNNDLIEMIAKLIEPYGDSLNEDHIKEVLEIICATDNILLKGTSQVDGFFSLADIEELMLEETRRIHDANLRSLFNKMNRMVGEDSVVLKKKEMLREIGIKVKKWRYYKNSIVTLLGRVPYERVALKGSSQKDRIALKSLGYKGHVYPVDELLGVTSLPFDMTLAAMLKTAKEACLADSYENAQNRLMESGIDINDDTIRAVINTVGGVVFDNERLSANEAANNFEKGTWSFPSQKKPGILYLEIGGSIVHIRNMQETKDNFPSEATVGPQILCDLMMQNPEQSCKQSSWMENKLGMAFSDDNLLRWTDKHGEKQHRILKRDYVSYIGEAREFSKFLLSMAVRNDYGSYQKTILISDGATWIRELKNTYFPDAQQILDYWQLCENVTNFSKHVFEMDESKYKPWSLEICELLKKSQTAEALKKIRNLCSKRLSRAPHDLIQYIENNIHNIDYAAYLKEDYFIGSDAIDSSNKSVIQRRINLPGMRWNLEAAQKIICLLTKLKSGRWEEDVVKAVYRHYNLKPGRQFNLT
ncbi:MAG: hypothetical protein LBR80_14255 [Deltaproteobacteria bacterium]|jgi:hypothetical protein|nr:hypothetical protein [Deltaproteobacteria bacterium]